MSEIDDDVNDQHTGVQEQTGDVSPPTPTATATTSHPKSHDTVPESPRWHVPESPRWRFVNTAKKTEGYSSGAAGSYIQGKSAEELAAKYVAPVESLKVNSEEEGEEIGRVAVPTYLKEVHDMMEEMGDVVTPRMKTSSWQPDSAEQQQNVENDENLAQPAMNASDDTEQIQQLSHLQQLQQETIAMQDKRTQLRDDILEAENKKKKLELETDAVREEKERLEMEAVERVNNRAVDAAATVVPIAAPPMCVDGNDGGTNNNNESDDKRQTYKKWGMYSLLAILLCVVVALVGAMASGNNNNDGIIESNLRGGEGVDGGSTQKPTLSPTASSTAQATEVSIPPPINTTSGNTTTTPPSESILNCPAETKYFDLTVRLGSNPSDIQWFILDRCTREIFYRCSRCYSDSPPNYPVAFGGCLPSYNETGEGREYVLQMLDLDGLPSYGYTMRYDGEVLDTNHFGEGDVGACLEAPSEVSMPSSIPSSQPSSFFEEEDDNDLNEEEDDYDGEEENDDVEEEDDIYDEKEETNKPITQPITPYPTIQIGIGSPSTNIPSSSSQPSSFDDADANYFEEEDDDNGEEEEDEEEETNKPTTQPITPYPTIQIGIGSPSKGCTPYIEESGTGTCGRDAEVEFKLLLPRGSPLDNKMFGSSITFVGNSQNIIAVGSGVRNSPVHIYQKPDVSSGSWEYLSSISLPGSSADVFTSSVLFGASLESNDEGYIIVGAPLLTTGSSTDSGKVYVCKPNSNFTRWDIVARLEANDDNGSSVFAPIFGAFISIDGTLIAVGSPSENGGKGAVYVFEHSGALGQQGNTWLMSVKLSPEDVAPSARFGTSVSIYGNAPATLAVGAPGDDGGGSAFVYRRDDFDWLPQKLAPRGIQAGDDFGTIVRISGCTVAVSAPEDKNTSNGSGTVRLFNWDTNGDVWAHSQIVEPTDDLSGDIFGQCIAIEGDTLLVGSPWDLGDNNEQSGVIYHFERIGGQWIKISVVSQVEHVSGDDDDFGCRLSLSGGDLFAVGSRGDDTLGPFSGAAFIFDLCPEIEEPEPV